MLLIGGYLIAWTLFGVVIYASDYLLHQIIGHAHWLEENAWLLGASALMLAGIYQFTPLKHLCLEKCRSPLSFIAEHWHGEHETRQAFMLGVHHGLFCVGCCWSLMLLMFAIGAGSLGWMLVLGAVMAAEKNLSWGGQLSKPLGMLLLIGGMAIVTALNKTIKKPPTLSDRRLQLACVFAFRSKVGRVAQPLTSNCHYTNNLNGSSRFFFTSCKNFAASAPSVTR
jgi:predicted metal-binding membrane protein